MPTDDPTRRDLEKDLIDAALALTGYTLSAAVVVPIPHTDPQVYVAVGEAEWLRNMLAGKK